MKTYEEIKKMDHHELAEAHAQALIEINSLTDQLARAYSREDGLIAKIKDLGEALRLNQVSES